MSVLLVTSPFPATARSLVVVNEWMNEWKNLFLIFLSTGSQRVTVILYDSSVNNTFLVGLSHGRSSSCSPPAYPLRKGHKPNLYSSVPNPCFGHALLHAVPVVSCACATIGPAADMFLQLSFLLLVFLTFLASLRWRPCFCRPCCWRPCYCWCHAVVVFPAVPGVPDAGCVGFFIVSTVFSLS